jgi:hypothetical protein
VAAGGPFRAVSYGTSTAVEPGGVVEVQTLYAQRAYDAYMSEISKVGEIYLGAAHNASKPVEESSRRVR